MEKPGPSLSLSRSCIEIWNLSTLLPNFATVTCMHQIDSHIPGLLIVSSSADLDNYASKLIMLPSPTISVPVSGLISVISNVWAWHCYGAGVDTDTQGPRVRV